MELVNTEVQQPPPFLCTVSPAHIKRRGYYMLFARLKWGKYPTLFQRPVLTLGAWVLCHVKKLSQLYWLNSVKWETTIMNESGMMKKQAVMVNFNVLSQNVLGRTGEYHDNI